jgi:hypothetical protein
MGATNKQGGAGMVPNSGAGAWQIKGGVNSTDQGGTGIKGNAESRSATEIRWFLVKRPSRQNRLRSTPAIGDFIGQWRDAA